MQLTMETREDLLITVMNQTALFRLEITVKKIGYSFFHAKISKQEKKSLMIIT